MKFKHKIIILCIFLFTAACSVNPTIHSNYNQTVDFSQYKTFDFFKPLDTDTRYESLTSQYLKQATMAEMTQRGFVLNNNKPDLLINFHRDTQDKQQINEVPIPGGFYQYQGRFYSDPWVSYRPYVDNYQEGKLNIDLVDSQSNKVVWQAEAVERISERKPNTLQGSLQKIVSQMFRQFPFTAQP